MITFTVKDFITFIMNIKSMYLKKMIEASFFKVRNAIQLSHLMFVRYVRGLVHRMILPQQSKAQLFMPHLWALCFLVCGSVRPLVCSFVCLASGLSFWSR